MSATLVPCPHLYVPLGVLLSLASRARGLGPQEGGEVTRIIRQGGFRNLRGILCCLLVETA